MDLLKIDHRTVNLDRLATIIEEETEPDQAEKPTRRLTLVIGQDRVSLDEHQSEAFLSFVHSNYRVRSLSDPGPSGAVGETES